MKSAMLCSLYLEALVILFLYCLLYWQRIYGKRFKLTIILITSVLAFFLTFVLSVSVGMQKISEKWNEIELLRAKQDTFNLYKKVKELTNGNRKQPTTVSRDANNEITMKIEAKLKMCRDYIGKFFNDDGSNEQSYIVNDEMGPAITKNEIIHAIRDHKSGKITGPDNTDIELIKIIEE